MKKLYIVMSLCSLIYGAVSPYSRVYDISDRSRYDSNISLFDITISLYNNPSDKTPYEEIINYFADSIYEQSNGAHKLGDVTIYTDGKNRSKADIIWNQREWPRAYTKCFMQNCGSIIFGDIAPFSVDYNMLLNRANAGYVLGHEWGHYVYGLYDEYKGSVQYSSYPSTPLITDTPTSYAIMNSTWDILGSAGFKSLNHSTSNNFSINTAQGRIYGKSGWDTLLQDTAKDPRNGILSVYPERIRYTNLIDYKPTSSDNWYKIEIPTINARSNLNIKWDSEIEQEFIVVLDKSSSMGTLGENNISLLNMAKDSVNKFIDILDTSDYIGLISFDENITLEFNLTKNSDKTALKNIVNLIEINGSTDIESALMSALKDFNYSKSSQKSVILLSDGVSNTQTYTKESVVHEFLEKKVPIISIAYGDGADEELLSYYADETYGSYIKSSLNFATNQNIFVKALSKVSDTSFIKNSIKSSTSNSFYIDNSISQFKVLANYESDSLISVNLISPSNTVYPLDCSNISNSKSYSCIVDVNGSVGNWSISSSIDTTYSIFTTKGSNFNVNIDILDATNSLEPIRLNLTTTGEDILSGLNIIAKIISSDGNISTLTLNDSGIDGDYLAKDGIYSAIFIPTKNGSYSIDVDVNNNSATAFYTQIGASGSLSDTLAEFIPTTKALSGNFQRSDFISFEFLGAINDTSTELNITNLDINSSSYINSKIDFISDRDWYDINTSSINGDIVIRIFDVYGFTPLLEILDKATSSVLYSKSFDSTRDEYLFLDINSSSIANIKVRVSDKTNTKTGVYKISAGDKLEIEAKKPDANFTYTIGDKAISFVSNSSSVGNIIDVLWQFGDEQNLSDINSTTHNYSSCSIFDVNLSITNSYGSNGSILKKIQSCKKPIISTNFETLAVKINTPFDLNTTVDYHELQNFKIDFDDNTTTTLKNISHSYSTYGNYTVKIDANGSDGNSSSKTIIINVIDILAPSIAITHNTYGNELNLSANVTNTDGNITSYKWYFDGAVVGEIQSISLNGKSCGEHNVTLYVENSYLKNSSISEYIQVCHKPTVTIVPNKTSLKLNEPFILKMSVSDVDSTTFTYKWDLGDGNSSTEKELTHRYQTAGTYKIKLTVTDEKSNSTTTELNISVSNSTEYQNLMSILNKYDWETNSTWQNRVNSFSAIITRDIKMLNYNADTKEMNVGYDLLEFFIEESNRTIVIEPLEAKYIYTENRISSADYELGAQFVDSSKAKLIIKDIRLTEASFDCKYLDSNTLNSIKIEYTKNTYESSINYLKRVSDFNETSHARYCFTTTFDSYNSETGELRASVNISPVETKILNFILDIDSIGKGENISYFISNIKFSAELRIDIDNNTPKFTLDSGSFKFHPDVYYDKYTLDSKTVSISLINGWNLISIPINQTTSSNTKFTNKIATYTYQSGNWSKNANYLNPKSGIWIKNRINETISFIGNSYYLDFKTYISGWNLVGSGDDVNTFDTSKIESVWSYKDGIWSKNPSKIERGRGFWIKVK